MPNQNAYRFYSIVSESHKDIAIQTNEKDTGKVETLKIKYIWRSLLYKIALETVNCIELSYRKQLTTTIQWYTYQKP